MLSIWHFRTWFSRHSGDGLTFELDDLRVLFNLNDSMILSTEKVSISPKVLFKLLGKYVTFQDIPLCH